MIILSSEEINLIKLLAKSESNKDGNEIHSLIKKIGKTRLELILQTYYRENTMSKNSELTETMEGYGISKDDGKSAISYVRRLGFNIF